MPSSSISGNILGYASGTQPGLVSTVAQTFAGDKTLSGLLTASGGILNTGLTGANATTATTSGSGKVGEIKSFSDTFTVSGWTKGTQSLTLQPGVYLWIAMLQLSTTAGLVRVYYALGGASSQTDGPIASQITTDGNPSSVKQFFANGFFNLLSPFTFYAWGVANGATPSILVSGSFLRVA